MPGKRQGRVVTAESPESYLAGVPLHFLPEFVCTNRKSPLHGTLSRTSDANLAASRRTTTDSCRSLATSVLSKMASPSERSAPTGRCRSAHIASPVDRLLLLLRRRQTHRDQVTGATPGIEPSRSLAGCWTSHRSSVSWSVGPAGCEDTSDERSRSSSG